MIKTRFQVLALALAIATPAFAQSKIDPAVVVRTVEPEYPADLKEAHVMGVVVVNFVVDEQGNVSEPTVQKSSNAGFEKPALEAVKKWKFKPARKDGVPVAKKVSVPIKFVIDS